MQECLIKDTAYDNMRSYFKPTLPLDKTYLKAIKEDLNTRDLVALEISKLIGVSAETPILLDISQPYACGGPYQFSTKFLLK